MEHKYKVTRAGIATLSADGKFHFDGFDINNPYEKKTHDSAEVLEGLILYVIKEAEKQLKVVRAEIGKGHFAQPQDSTATAPAAAPEHE